MMEETHFTHAELEKAGLANPTITELEQYNYGFEFNVFKPMIPPLVLAFYVTVPYLFETVQAVQNVIDWFGYLFIVLGIVYFLLIVLALFGVKDEKNSVTFLDKFGSFLTPKGRTSKQINSLLIMYVVVMGVSNGWFVFGTIVLLCFAVVRFFFYIIEDMLRFVLGGYRLGIHDPHMLSRWWCRGAEYICVIREGTTFLRKKMI